MQAQLAFRKKIESTLNKRPIKTANGNISKNLIDASMGCPMGGHEIEPLWLYQPKNADVEMLFGFYPNFTPNDLICKIVPPGEYPKAQEGASVQFNADRCIQYRGGDYVLEHHGRITIRYAIARDKLMSAIETICPAAMKKARIGGVWPVEIGTASDVSKFADQLFMYAYCVEQGKRQLRGETPLPIIN